MKKSAKIFFPIIIIIIGAGSMFFLISQKEKTPRREAKAIPKIVTTEIVKLNNINTNIAGYGKIISSQPIDLVTEVNGPLIGGDIDFKPGYSFNKGDLLIKIDDRQIKLKINSQKSELLSALAQLLPEIKNEYPDDYINWESFFKDLSFKKQLGELPEVVNQKIKLFLARFKVYQLYFAIKDMEIELEKHYFKAPFNGSIIECNKRVGANVRTGNVLGKIVNINDLEVEVAVPIEDVRWIDEKANISLKSREITENWSGKIERISSNIESKTQTISVYISLNNNNNDVIPEGLFIDADVPGKEIANAYAVPRKAIYNDSFVYLVNNGVLEFRKVNIERFEDKYALVNDGLSDGDTLVVELLQGISPGMPAKPIISTTTERSR